MLARGERARAPILELPWHATAQVDRGLLEHIEARHDLLVMREMLPTARLKVAFRRSGCPG